MGFAQNAAEEARIGTSFLVALEGRGVQNYEATEVFVFFAVLYASAAGGEMYSIRCGFFLWVEFLCDAGVWMVLITCYSFYGRSYIVGCSAVGYVEQPLERPWCIIKQKDAF